MSHKVWNFKKLFIEEIMKKGGWVNAHLHADRAWTMNPSKLDLWKKHDLIAKWDIVDEVKANASVDEYYSRFCDSIETMLEQGVTAAGSFVDCDTVCEDRAIRGALKARENYKGVFELVLVNQPLKGLFNKGEMKWFEHVADLVDIIGGLPKRDKIYHDKELEHLDIIFSTAKKMNKMLHVHTDQLNTTQETETELLCDKTMEYGMQDKVVAIHGISIAAHKKEYRKKVYKKMVEAGVMMIACPTAWVDTKRSEELQPFHNSVTPIDELIPAGVTVAMGTDNLCDYMVPYCDGDMYGELRLISSANRYLEIDELVNMASTNGRKVLGLPIKKEEKDKLNIEFKFSKEIQEEKLKLKV